ncbi:MAG: TonB C-terminal domain-containing protein [Caulobacter sp.]|nr:TonB C-terminal domain-containing protein [Vitreoscilla sp.]
MSALAESDLDPVSPWRLVWRVLIVIVVVALVAGLVVFIRGMLGGSSAPHRQTARISILPDTPPPPPPPRDERKPEPPKDEPRQAMREEPVKQEAPKPADAPIKMEGPAGDGPSVFSGGNVKNDYNGGAPVIGGNGAGTGPDRAQERLYATSVRQLLHDEIEKHLPSDNGEVLATFSVWIDPDGTIRRFELVPTGVAARDAALRTAFDQTARLLHLPTHGGLPQPMRFRLSVRPA